MLQRKSSTGLDNHIAIFLGYLLGWISGLVMLLIEKDSPAVRYHAAQSVVLFGALTVMSILLPLLPVIGPILQGLLGLLTLVLWLVLIITALNKDPVTLKPIQVHAENLERALGR